MYLSFTKNWRKKKNLFFSRVIKQLGNIDANPTKWSNTLKQFVGKLPTNCLSFFVNFAGLALKGLTQKLATQTAIPNPYSYVVTIVNRY